MEKVAFGEAKLLSVVRVRSVIINCFDDLAKRHKVSNASSIRIIFLIGGLTFFGGTMATADLGVREMWWGLGSGFSLLTERRNICGKGSATGHVCFQASLVIATATYIHVEIVTASCETKRDDFDACGARIKAVDKHL